MELKVQALPLLWEAIQSEQLLMTISVFKSSATRGTLKHLTFSPPTISFRGCFKAVLVHVREH